MKFIGARTGQVTGLDELPGRSNYFLGEDSAKWHANVPTYSKVRYADIYPGVDLIYYGTQQQLEYDLVVAPGARPEVIRLSIEGAKKLVLRGGDLVLHTDCGDVKFSKPKIYQTSDGVRREINGHYVLKGKHEVGFQLAAYNKNEPLIIDPVLAYSTYLGGSGNDSGNAIAVDSFGNVYIAGYTESLNFPTANAVQGLLGTNGRAGRDAFLTEINPQGNAVIFSTFLGGSGDDRANAIALDIRAVYLAGETASPDFPVTNGVVQKTFAGPTDAFVTKLSLDGSTLIYSTYLGGVDPDQASGIAVDTSGNAFITGRTDSSNFPTTAGAYQVASAGPPDAFVSVLNPTGTAFVYSTYLGAEGADQAYGIFVDSSSNAFVTGSTSSLNFPGLNAFQNGNNGGTDVFVSKLNATGTGLFYSTLLGGLGTDQGNAIVVDASGNAYVTGFTNSSNFPVANAIQPALAGSFANAFVAKFSPSGSALIYSTYLGGNGGSSATAIAVNSAGNAFITGNAGAGFPSLNPVQSAFGGGTTNAFVSQLDPTGKSLVYSTYLGGRANDQGLGITVDSNNNTYVVGIANSANFPTTSGAFQIASKGGSDAFVTKISNASNPLPALSTISPTSAPAGGPGFTLNLNGSNFVSSSVVQWNGSPRPTTFVASNQLSAAIPASDLAVAGTVQVTVFNPPTGGGTSNAISFTIVPSAPATISSISPTSATVAGSSFTLTVIGTNFSANSVVQWNGASLVTAFVSSTQLTAVVPAANIASIGTAQITVSTPGGTASNALSFAITGGQPSINAGGTVNGASFAPGVGVSPGSIATAFGTNLLAASSGGISVQLNGITAPVFASTAQQVNFQVPWELSGQSQASMIVTVNGISSSPVTVSLANTNPGLFSANVAGSSQGAVLISNTAIVAAPVGTFANSRPANRGEFITIYCTGLGAVSNQPGTGVKAGASPLSATTTLPVVTIGGLPAQVGFSGLAPGFFGLYQVDVQVPQILSPGSAVPVVLNIGGVSSNSVTIAIQ